MPATAVFRTDANAQIGLGHVMRSLALAQAWCDAGGRAVFVIAGEVPAVRVRLESDGIEVRQLTSHSGTDFDAVETQAILAEVNAQWLVLDGYHFDVSYVSHLRLGKAALTLFDDHAARSKYDAEIVLNPNIFALPDMYPNHQNRTQFLLGLQYALLRREFCGQSKQEAVVPSIAQKLLITMGGSDPKNVSAILLNAINHVEIDNLEITVIVGGANPHLDRLKHAAESSRYPVQLLLNVTDMAAVLKNTEAAITAPGGTCAELALMGIPMFLVTIAENHVMTGQEFAAQQLAVSVGWYKERTIDSLANSIQRFLEDSQLRRKIAQNALSRVDGQGAKRVVEAMLHQRKATGV